MPSLSATPALLDASQVGVVLELLDLRERAPEETAARFLRFSESKLFSPKQREAVEWLFALDEERIPKMLLAFADDEARPLVREQMAYEARLSYVAS